MQQVMGGLFISFFIYIVGCIAVRRSLGNLYLVVTIID